LSTQIRALRARGTARAALLAALALAMPVCTDAQAGDPLPARTPLPAQTDSAHALPVPALGEEQVPPGEPAEIAEVQRLTTERFMALYPPGVRPVLRDAHPKMHGLVRAEFTVEPDLPQTLRYGILKTPRTFQAWIRFSASSETPRPDTQRDGHGMAIKLMGVEGAKLLESERNETTQDFVMINFPTFFVPDIKDYLAFNIALEKKAQGEFFKAHPAQFVASNAIVDQQVNNPLQIQYWSETPYKLGPHAIKFSARPVSPQHDPAPASPGPEYLRDAMERTLQNEDVVFDFLVQVQTDPSKMPVEDALTRWDETLSPFRKVATIRIPKQAFASPAQMAFGENLSFTPWHSLPEHRPLGGINRARRTIYESISTLRHRMNGAPRKEPVAGQGIGN
jgi:hypothetical protein